MKTILPLLVVALLATCALAQNAPCSDAKVEFQTPPADLVSKVSVQTVSNAEVLGSLAKQSTTQQTRWFAASNPDYTKPGPWNTAILVGDKHSTRPFLKISISDHGNTLTAAWISEKLLHLTVWWGRIAASDVIIDVEKHHVIYHELGNYGQLVSCSEPK